MQESQRCLAGARLRYHVNSTEGKRWSLQKGTQSHKTAKNSWWEHSRFCQSASTKDQLLIPLRGQPLDHKRSKERQCDIAKRWMQIRYRGKHGNLQNITPPLKLTNRTCKWMVGRLYTFLLGCHVFRCYLSFREGYSYKWPYTWATGVITLLIRVLTPVLISRGPPCTPEISVIAMLQGGEECDPKATMEIGKCPRRCGGQKFCEWTVWGTCLGLQIHKSDMFIHILVYRIGTYFAVYT